MELLDRARVVAKILLATDKNYWKVRAEVENFRDPLYATFVSEAAKERECV